MDSKTKKIVDYLKSKFKAEIIILEGSRASSHYRDDSDWDLYLFVSNKEGTSTGWHLFENELLDLHFVELPVSRDYIMKGAFGPRPYTHLLLDNSESLGESIVAATKKARSHKSKPISKVSYSVRKLGLQKNIAKIRSSFTEPVICFYYVENFYNRAIRLWFDLQQKWPLHPKEALPYIKENDPEFYKLITELVITSNWQKKPIICQKICTHLFNN